MAWPLFFLTQVNYMGANEAWLSYIAVSANILIWLTVRPWSRFIERHGIRFALVIGCLGLVPSPLLTVFSASLPAAWGLPSLLLFSLLNGLTFSAFQLTILQCLLEVVPVRFKALNLSFYTTILLLANTIMPMFGVQIYTWLGSDLRAMTWAMGAASVVRLLGTLLFFLRWVRMKQESDCGIRV
jgi:MFS family permease